MAALMVNPLVPIEYDYVYLNGQKARAAENVDHFRHDRHEQWELWVQGKAGAVVLSCCRVVLLPQSYSLPIFSCT